MVPFIVSPSANNHPNPPTGIKLYPFELSVKLEPSVPPPPLLANVSRKHFAPDFDIECTNMQHESMSKGYVSLFEVKITRFY